MASDFPGEGTLGSTVRENPRARTVIADHELLHRIGEGSYGEVWLARNVFGQFRAVKIVYRRTFEDQRPYEREFRGIQKFEPLSRAHESQVDILHVGRNDDAGYFYYIMELADDLHSGQTIRPEIYCPKTLKSVLVQQGRLSFSDTLQIALNLTAALDHLHQHGLVHRDIKPSNIVFIQGTPRLADIGLVAHISEARSFVGTEGFIPPEGPGSIQADLYSLGKVIYQICLGQKDKAFPDLPDKFDELPDHERLLELNEIIVKACESDLRVRYKTAAEMRADLLLLAGGKSVKRLRLVERRLAAITRASIALSILALVALAVVFQVSHQKQVATQRLVRSHVDVGIRFMDDGDLFTALLWFAEALRLDADNPAREENHRIRIASVLRECPKLVGVFVHEQGQVNQAAFSPDGRHLATASDDQTAAIWDLASGQRAFSLKHRSQVYQVLFSSDGTKLATADRSDSAQVWDTVTGKPIGPPRKHHRVAGGLCFSPDGTLLVTFPEDDIAQVWNLSTGLVGPALKHDTLISSLCFSPDGRAIVSTTGENKVRLWDATTGARLPPSLAVESSITDAVFSRDGQLLATESDDACVELWDWRNGRMLLPEMRHHHFVQSLSFSPQGDRLLTTTLDKTAQIWSVATRQSLIVPLPHNYRVYGGIFTPDGRRVVTTSGSIYARVWDAATGDPLTPPLKHFGPIRPGNISADGRLLVTLNRDQASRGDQAVRVWDLAARDPLVVELTPVARPNLHAPFTKNQRWKVNFGQENTARVLEVSSGRPLTPPLRHTEPLRQAFFSPDDRLVVTETLSSYARLWDAATGEALSPVLATKYVSRSHEAHAHTEGSRPFAKAELRHDRRPVADIVRLAQMMSGNRVDDQGGWVPLELPEVTSLWARLKAVYPDDFSSSLEKTAAWHDREAAASESDCDWWAARFHLQRLAELRRADETVKAGLAYVQLALDQEARFAATNRSFLRPIPPRNPSTPSNLIDLSSAYDRSLREFPATTAEISSCPRNLPLGLQTFAGVTFDVRGRVSFPSGTDRSPAVTTIELQPHQKCQRLRFLQAASHQVEDGNEIGRYRIHYVDGHDAEIPLVYGKDLRAWRVEPTEPLEADDAKLAWIGTTPAARANAELRRAFVTTWNNPSPGVEISRVEFHAKRSDRSAWLFAITLE